MTIIKRALAGIAGAALLASQSVAAAAPARDAASLDGSEQLAGGLSPLLVVLGVFALFAAVILVTEDDDDDVPFSP